MIAIFMQRATRRAVDAVSGTAPPAREGQRMANIVLVHGAWSTAAAWSKVIPFLQSAGHQVVAVENELRSLTSDSIKTRVAIDAFEGKTIVVGHSYGGAIITAAARDAANVTALVYIAAFAPDQGESLTSINAKFSPPSGAKFIAPGNDGLLVIDRKNMPAAFAADVPAAEAAVMAETQRPVSGQIFADKMGPPAWRQHKSWYQVSEDDRMINPGAERFMASRAGATTISLKASHASLVSMPSEVAGLIFAACAN
jgi:pimeloyl-ACP methyl ester carboxylesterase